MYYCRSANLISFNKISEIRLAPLSKQTSKVLSVTPTRIVRKRNVEPSLQIRFAPSVRVRVELRAHVARTRHYRARGTSIDVFPGRGPGGEGESRGINVDFWQERIGINGKFARLNGLQMFSGPGGTIARAPKVVSEAISRFAFRRIENSVPLLLLSIRPWALLSSFPSFLSSSHRRTLRLPHLPVFALVKNDSPSTSRHI